jgi:predicted Rossmann fold flavoprotein
MAEVREVPVCVVGAGAAGLWAAAAAARRGADVLVLEKTPRVGTKILASGGSRCNLTTTLDARSAARWFGPAERFVLPGFRALPPEAVRRRFASLGVPTVIEPAFEKVFPKSGRAVDVRDALVADAASQGVEISVDRPVTGVEPLGADRWKVTCSRGGDVICRRLVLAAGGASYPRSGTTGDGYAWLASLGLEVTPPVPALVPLASDARWVRELSGVALPEASVRLVDSGGRVLAERARPLLFTHTGVSGPGAMDVSVFVARAEAEGKAGGAGAGGMALLVDLAPAHHEEALRAALFSGDASARLHARLPVQLPRRLRPQVATQAQLSEEDPRTGQISRTARHRLVQVLKGLRIPVSGTLGWEKAEVTAGGLALGEVNRKRMEVTRHPGLFVTGELLDATGPIGGFSFQLAFATGELAGEAAARSL